MWHIFAPCGPVCAPTFPFQFVSVLSRVGKSVPAISCYRRRALDGRWYLWTPRLSLRYLPLSLGIHRLEVCIYLQGFIVSIHRGEPTRHTFRWQNSQHKRFTASHRGLATTFVQEPAFVVLYFTVTTATANNTLVYFAGKLGTSGVFSLVATQESGF